MKKFFAFCPLLLALVVITGCKSGRTAAVCGMEYTSVDIDIIFVPILSDSCYEGLMTMYFDDKFGFADSTGNVVIEPVYDGARHFSEGLCAVWVDAKCGFIDKSGHMVITPQFEDAQEFSEGLAAVKVNDMWGYVDKTGKVVVPLQYYRAYDFRNGVAEVWTDYDWEIYVDKQGNEYEDSEKTILIKKIEVDRALWRGTYDKNGYGIITVPAEVDTSSQH